MRIEPGTICLAQLGLSPERGSFSLLKLLETTTGPFGVEIRNNTVFIVMPPDLGLTDRFWSVEKTSKDEKRIN